MALGGDFREFGNQLRQTGHGGLIYGSVFPLVLVHASNF